MYTFRLNGASATALIGTADGLLYQAQLRLSDPVPVTSAPLYEYSVPLNIKAP